MRKLLVPLALLLTSIGPSAWANASDLVKAGMGAQQRGDWSQAADLYGQALASGELSPKGRAQVLGLRANAYGTQGLYTVNVFTGLRITSVGISGLRRQNLKLSFTSQVGHNYYVQSFSALVNGLVRDLVPGMPGTGGIVQTIIPNAFTQPQQYYRIHQE